MATRKVVIVPTLLTLGNAVCGLASIAYASKIGKVGSTPESDLVMLAASGWLILAAMVFDALDGYFARLFKMAGHFGAELDSLCDAVSFGAAPAFLLLQIGPGWDQPRMHQLLAAVATLYLMCAILRLARYNVEAFQGVGGGKRFRGLPSPAAAGCVATLAVLRGELSWVAPAYDTEVIHVILEAWATLGAFAVALLMVSAVPYPHLTKQMLRGGRRAMALALPSAIVIVFFRDLSLAVLFWLYAVTGVVRYATRRLARESEEGARV